MTPSLNEVASLIYRAALGPGWTAGLAREAAQAATWLHQRGEDGLNAALSALQDPPRPPIAAQTPGGWHFAPQPVIALGPSPFELLETPDVSEVVCQDPGPLLLGYAGVAAGRYHCAYRLTGAGVDVTVPAKGVLPGSATLAGAVCVTKAAPAETEHQTSANQSVDPETWARLQQLATASYVEATEASRAAGAGAGLNDND